MLDQCPLFAGSQTEFADEGTARHEVLKEALSGRDYESLLDSDEDREAITWALDYIKLHAPLKDYPLEVEQKRTWLGPDFSDRSGTPDYVCGPHIFDFKWRPRDYAPQMADYALERMDAGHEVVIVHILFGATKRVERIVFTRTMAEELVGGILARANDPNAKPAPCDYCGWCAKRLTCPAVLDRVNAVVDGRVDWGLETYHSSEIATAEQMGKALAIARLVAKWADAVEHYAKKMVGRGEVPAGYRIQDKQGKRYITSVSDAFSRCGLPQDEFLKACEIKLSSLVEIHKAKAGIKKAAAEREIVARLGDVVQRKAPGKSLVSVKSKMEDEEQGED